MQLATTAEQINSVFELRHRVFVEQENMLKPNAEKRLYDRYDSFPSTVQMLAQHQGQTVGAFRFSLDDTCGLPADEYFDFRRFVPNDARLMHAGMFCVHRDFRAEKIAIGLILMASYYAISNKVTHVVAPINPRIAPLLKGIGFRIIGEQFHDPHLDHDVLPLLLDIKELRDFFVDFIHQNQMHDFIMDYQRWFCKEGETIVKTGDEGDKAFIIIDGSVEVVLPDTKEPIAILSDGEMFGELAVITNERRTADVIAKTDVQMMVMTREVFLKRFVEDSQKALILMRMISNRSRRLVEHDANS